MKHTKGWIAVAAAAVLVTGCATKHLAYPYSKMSEKKQRQSVPLWLPRTVIEFRATCEMETVTPSPLYAEAASANKAKPRFSLIELETAAKRIGVKVATNTTRTIKLKEPSLGVRGERDPEQLYFVYLNNELFTAVDFETEYAPDGVVGSVSSARQNQALEFTLKTLESVASVAGAVLKTFSVPPDMKVSDIPVAETNVPLALAERIEFVRKQRNELRFTPGARAGLDGAELSRLLDDLDKEEGKLLANFEGKIDTQPAPVIFTYRPPRGRLTNEVTLAQLKTNGGFASEQLDPNVWRSALPPGLLGGTGTNEAKLVITFVQRDSTEKEVLTKLARVVSTNLPNGLPYQVPAQFGVTVSHVDAEKHATALLTTDILIGQWGVISCLPKSMGTPGSSIKPVYYTDTGALKKLTVGSKPPATDSTRSLGTATATITDAVRAREDAASEIAELKKKKEKLELEVAIKRAQTELGGTNAP